VFRLESFTLKNQSVSVRASWTRSLFNKPFHARYICSLFLAIFTIGLMGCTPPLYYFPQFTFANRPIPPSQLANRVMVGVTANGTQGSLAILDANRDIRSNVQDTIKTFAISGYSGGYPDKIYNFPEEILGYVFSDSDGSLAKINYGTEASGGSAGTFVPHSTSLAIPQSFSVFVAAIASASELVVIDNASGRSYTLNLPNAYQAATNTGGTVALAMVRNSNTLYRVIKLNSNQANPPGAVDCQPYILPVYCVVPVPDNPKNPGFDHPIGAYFSLDGTTAYILNCGPECGGTTASVSIIPQGSLYINNIPTTSPIPSPVTGNILVPGGVTTALSDGTTLYVAGQQLLPDGLFTGNLSTINIASNTVTAKYGISDGMHTKLLFADDNTLWIGSSNCANGERAKNNTNYNCLTMFNLGTNTPSIVPAVTPGSPTAQVPYPNEDLNLYYYGSLTGLCWIQNLHKVYTAYGGQVHAFNTTDGSEINNSLITVQGTALDVAYMDAVTDAAD
jgi:hypothetical protein